MAQAVKVWAKGRLGGLHEQAVQYARQKKIDLSEALKKYGLEDPEIPQGFEFVWDWFFELIEGRQHNGFGLNPISWSEMTAWANANGMRLRPWLTKCFRKMDQEWINAAREQEDGERRANSGDKNRGRRSKKGNR